MKRLKATVPGRDYDVSAWKVTKADAEAINILVDMRNRWVRDYGLAFRLREELDATIRQAAEVLAFDPADLGE